MTHMLDTDHLSLLQYRNSPERAVMVARINSCGEANVTAPVVSFHEQMRGAHSLINSARTRDRLVGGYSLMSQIITDYRQFVILPFDAASAAVCEALAAMKLKVKPMDLRIAAVALANALTLVTRNLSDFGKVPGLRTEDWTK